MVGIEISFTDSPAKNRCIGRAWVLLVDGFFLKHSLLSSLVKTVDRNSTRALSFQAIWLTRLSGVGTTLISLNLKPDFPDLSSILDATSSLKIPQLVRAIPVAPWPY